MDAANIALHRLDNQHVARQRFHDPVEVVQWLGAVQAQDYFGAKWALGLRVLNPQDAVVEQAFSEGRILRTHVLRPTWHFVTPADIRWMLQLTAPRVHALNAYYYRKNELDAAVFARSHQVLTEAMTGGRQLTRAQITGVFHEAGIATNELRFTLLLMEAELEGLICSGARHGKQFTYTLLDERAPNAIQLERDEALAELTARYFTGHGPATVQDFVWWSGLTVADARAGLEMVSARLMQEMINGQPYWYGTDQPVSRSATPTAYLMPNYDECLASYKDRSAALDPKYAHMWDRDNAIFSHHLVIDGQILGAWKRTLKAKAVLVEISPFITFNASEHEAVTAAAQRYADFLGLKLDLVIQSVEV